MASLPSDRTKLALAQGNQNPLNVLSSAANKNALTEAYDTIDTLYNFTTGLISQGTLSRLGIINVMDYNASGLATTFIGSIASGSKVLTLTTTPDFVAGQGINLQGAFEVASLAVTAGASSSANCTVTLNGVATTVALTSGNTATEVATAIRAATFAGWTTGGSGTTVTFTSTTSGTKTDATYSAGTTSATGTMTTTTQGTADQISTVSSVSGLVVNIADNSTRTITAGTIKHDDNAAFQLAVNQAIALGKDEITVPYGTYNYTTLTNTSGITFIGDGVTLTGTTALTLVSLAALSADVAQRGINITKAPYNADLTGNIDISSTMLTAIVAANGAPIFIPAGLYKWSNQITITQDIEVIADGATIIVSSAMVNMISSSGKINISGSLTIDGNNNLTGAALYQTTAMMPRLRGVTFKNLAYHAYDMLPGVVTTQNDIGYVDYCKFYNVMDALSIYGGYHNYLIGYGEITVSNSYWHTDCGASFHVQYCRSAKYLNNIIYSDATLDATDGSNWGYLVDSVTAIGNKVNGGKRGPCIGKMCKHVRIIGNEAINITTNGLQLDARVGHVDSAAALNLLGFWDVTTGSPSVTYPSAVNNDMVRVSVGGSWNGWDYRVDDLVMYNNTDLIFTSPWFVDFPNIDCIASQNVIHVTSAGRACYIQASGVDVYENRFQEDGGTNPTIRVNGGARVRVKNNNVYWKTTDSTQHFVHASRFAIVTAYDNNFMDLNGSVFRGYKYYSDANGLINVGDFRTITNPTASANIYIGNDRKVLVSCNASFNLRLPGAGSAQNIVGAIEIYRIDNNSNTYTLNTDGGGGTINGQATLVIAPGQSLIAICNGDDAWTVQVIERALQSSGTTAQRPTVSQGLRIGAHYYDTDVAEDIVHVGADVWRIKKSGTATILASGTSIVVAHGMGTTPTSITATPQGNVGSVWITSISSTNFTINCSSAPAGNTVVTWSAKA